MTANLWLVAVTAVVAGLLSYLLAFPLRRLALRYGFQDRPSPRHHGELKPRLGGVGIFVAFVAAVAMSAPWVSERTAIEAAKIWGVVAGGAVVVLMGALDDRFELPPGPQLAGQLLAAGVAILFGVVIDGIPNPLGSTLEDSTLSLSGPLAVAFTFFWMVGSMNAINFIDGLDGQAAGVTAIAAVVLFLHSFLLTQYSIALLPLALAGACLGFLPHNFHPAKLTMGTSGAVFLGFSLGTLSVIGGTKAATLLLVLGLPIVDALWIILGRLLRGRSPFRGDRTHLHHRLAELGLSSNQIVFIFYGLCVLFGTLALVLASRTQKLYVLGGMVLLLGAFLALITQKTMTD